jgi:hypothetical protein
MTNTIRIDLDTVRVYRNAQEYGLGVQALHLLPDFRFAGFVFQGHH